MKALIIGIDGGDKRILDFFDLSFYSELKSRCDFWQIREDFLSRGWAKIMTGRLGWDTRAFYNSPILDGTYRFNQSFRMEQVQKLPGIKPIWDMVGERGHRVGIMNVPTTYPAAKVNGFFVGSAGGGIQRIEGIPETLVYPRDILVDLENAGYVVDIRFKSSGIRDLEELLTRLKTMERRRAEVFVDLCKKNDTDFGFLVDRGTVVLQYLAMSEIEALLSSDVKAIEDGDSQPPMEQHLREFYVHLDETIRLLIEELKPEHLILTADHGQAPCFYRGNLNVFLERHGWLCSPSLLAWILARSKQMVRKRLSKRFGDSVADALPTNFRRTNPEFDKRRTKAFGRNYISGIYINDERRFRGPVEEGQELDRLVIEICQAFNDSPEAVRFEMSARPFRKEHANARYADCLPDIFVDTPDTIFFDGRGKEVVRDNPNYGPLPDLTQVDEDMFSGTKGHHPILLMDPKTRALVRDSDPRDLRLVYKLVDRIFEK